MLKYGTYGKCPANIQRQMKQLCFQPHGRMGAGIMLKIIEDYEDWDVNFKVIYILEDKKVIGWAALKPTDDRYGSFYVNRKYRRKGYGKLLYNAAKKRWKDFIVCPHDAVSTAFFQGVGAY